MILNKLPSFKFLSRRNGFNKIEIVICGRQPHTICRIFLWFSLVLWDFILFYFICTFKTIFTALSPSECPVPPAPKCYPEERYRNFEGTCNNIKNPFWGAYLNQYERFMKPSFEDGKTTRAQSYKTFRRLFRHLTLLI